MILRAALVLLAACGGREAVTSCDSDLRGAWRSETGQRWVITATGEAREAYPDFDDTKLPGVTVEVGARAIDLAGTRGEVKRRFTSAGTTCIAKAPANLTRCADDTLEIVLADPAPPISFSPCGFGRPEPTHRERWTRE